jgi:predicted phage-related endonuclease
MIERIPAGDRATWLELRGKDVTASAAAALLGVHPFITAYELWALKAGKIAEDPEETAPMRRGRLLEPVAVQMLREERPDWVITHNTGAAQVYLRDPSVRIGATPDVLAVDPDRGPGLVQIKTVEPGVFRAKWFTDGEVQPPLWIVIQAIIEAKLTGSSWAAVAPLVVGFGVEMPIVEIPIHEGVYDKISAEVVKFWAMIGAGEEPEPDYSRDDALLSRLDRGDNGLEVDLSTDNMLPELLEERAELKARIKADTERTKDIDSEIITKLGPHERAFIPGWRVSRPTIRRAGYTVQPTTYRQLKISPVK